MKHKKNNDRQELAIALFYDEENVPRVTATGQGDIARHILAVAEEHNIPLEDDPELAALLAQIPLGDEIPEALYQVVAEVIAFAYVVAGKFPADYPMK